MTSTPLKLYYYEHCPYCVRVLAFIGLHGIEVERHVMLNDDEITPIQMIGKKMAPILQTGPNQYMAESLDIIDYLAETNDIVLEKTASDISAVEQLLADNRQSIYALTMPRWVQIDYQEFATPEAIAYFTKKKTETIGDFSEALKQTDTYVEKLSTALANQSSLFSQLTEKTTSLASIMLFSGLYGVSCVKNFPWPAQAAEFIQQMAQKTGCQLDTARAV